MLLVLEPDADLDAVRAELARRGAAGAVFRGGGRRVVVLDAPIEAHGIPGVAAVLAAESPHPLVDRAPRVLDLGGGVTIGGPRPALIAGPCAVEDEDGIHAAAAAVARAGGRFLRGGAFKPRTSPYAFAGLGAPGLRLLREAADAHGLRVVTEVLASADVPLVAAHADVLQIGSRTMQAFDLLRAAGRARKPVLLKRGMAATVEEWLLAAEHLFAAGAPAVVLCERGIRTFPQPTRNTLDLGAVAWLVAHRRLPVVVDPSHAAGRRELVLPLARAALAAGAHGVMVEVHPDPGRARSDAAQAIAPEALAALGAEMRGRP
jgi:3-deoxy-7-phosphoheptulonate synthase